MSDLWGVSEDSLVPPELIEAARILATNIESDRISVTVSRQAPGLGGRSLREVAADGDCEAVLSFVRQMFAYENVTG